MVEHDIDQQQARNEAGVYRDKESNPPPFITRMNGCQNNTKTMEKKEDFLQPEQYILAEKMVRALLGKIKYDLKGPRRNARGISTLGAGEKRETYFSNYPELTSAIVMQYINAVTPKGMTLAEKMYYLDRDAEKDYVGSSSASSNFAGHSNGFMGSPFDSDRIFSSSTSGQSKTRGSFTISRPSSFNACYLCLDGDVVFTNYKRDPRFYNLDGTPKYCEEEIKKMMQEEEEERRKLEEQLAIDKKREEEERRKLEEQLAIDKKREEEEKWRRWREWKNSPEGKREEAKGEARRNLEEFTCKLALGATFCCWAYIIFLSARFFALEDRLDEEDFCLLLLNFVPILLLFAFETVLLWKPLQILKSILSTVLYAVAWVVCKEFLIRRNIRKAERQRSSWRNNTRAS